LGLSPNSSHSYTSGENRNFQSFASINCSCIHRSLTSALIRITQAHYPKNIGQGFLGLLSFLLFFCFAFSSPPIFAISANPEVILGLDEAIKIGIEKNYSLSLSHDQTELADVNRSGGQGRFLPSASADFTHSGKWGEGKPQTKVGASLNWLIFDGMQSYHAFHQLQALSQSATLAERVALEGLLENIMLAYYDIVEQNQKLKAIHDLLEVSQERGKLSNAKLEVGSGSRLEQLQSIADLNQDSSTFLNQEVALRDAQIKLSQLLALDPSILILTTDTLSLADVQPLEEWRKNLLTNNSSIAMSRSQRDASAYAIKEAHGRWLPSLNTGLAYSAAPDALNDRARTQPGAIIYSANLSLPLFDKWVTPTAVRRAKIELRQNTTRIKMTEADVTAEFEKSSCLYASGMRQIALELRNLEVARLQAEGARERYRVGASSPLEFRDAQTKLLNAELRLIAARVSAKQAETSLQRLAGLLIKLVPAHLEGK
jgi:outer membrane protein